MATKKKRMTPQEFAEKMIEIRDEGDIESRHGHADDLMCKLLESMGYGEGVKIFDDMGKWYA